MVSADGNMLTRSETDLSATVKMELAESICSGATGSIGVQYWIEEASTGMSGTETAMPMPVRLLTAGRKKCEESADVGEAYAGCITSTEGCCGAVVLTGDALVSGTPVNVLV